MVSTKVRLITLFAAKDEEALYNQQNKTWSYCGSDHELLIAKSSLNLKVELTWSTYNLTQNAYDYTGEVKNRFKWLDLVDRVHEELWTEVGNIVQEVLAKTIPKGGKIQEAEWLSEEAL